MERRLGEEVVEWNIGNEARGRMGSVGGKLRGEWRKSMKYENGKPKNVKI